MYENTIEEILERDSFTKKIFVGCLSRDELPPVLKKPSCFVINTEPRSSKGEHWLAFYFEKDTCYFFDSYGLSPKYYGFEKYIKQNSKKLVFNKQRLQGLSNYCGLYCILFLIFRARNDLKIFYNNFFKDFYLNDKLILKYLKYY